MWKVYHIQSGRIVKAGFDSDDQAKEWLERRKDLAEDEHDIDEMDEEEEEEFLEREAEEEDEVYEPEFDEDGDREIPYPEGGNLGGDIDEDDDHDHGDHDDEEDDDHGDEEDYGDDEEDEDDY